MRLGFAIAAFLQADVLLLDEVFAVGDENFQRKCFGVIAAFKSQGGTILFVSHDAQAVERLCERSILLSHGEKAFDGPTHEAIVRYRRFWQTTSTRRAGRGCASGARARPRSRRPDARRRAATCAPNFSQASRSPRGRPAAHCGIDAPRLHLEVRDTGGLLVAEDALDTGRSAGPRRGRVDRFASTIDRPPLAFGRFRVRLGLVAVEGARCTSSMTRLAFLVYPDGEERGLVHLGGTWRAGAKQEVR